MNTKYIVTALVKLIEGTQIYTLENIPSFGEAMVYAETISKTYDILDITISKVIE